MRLDFTVQDRRFVVRRTPEWTRPKRRGTGLLTEKASASITETTGGGERFLSSRAAEVGLQVGSLMGMNASQFVQVALLPQGEFQTFLRASSQDRHDVLQQLFRTDRFARIETWVGDHSRRLVEQADTGRSTVQRLLDTVADRAGLTDARRPVRRLAGVGGRRRPRAALGGGRARGGGQPRRSWPARGTTEARAAAQEARRRHERGRARRRAPPSPGRRARRAGRARGLRAGGRPPPARRSTPISVPNGAVRCSTSSTGPGPPTRRRAPAGTARCRRCAREAPDRLDGSADLHRRAGPDRASTPGSPSWSRRCAPASPGWRRCCRASRSPRPLDAPATPTGPGCAPRSSDLREVEVRTDAVPVEIESRVAALAVAAARAAPQATLRSLLETARARLDAAVRLAEVRPELQLLDDGRRAARDRMQDAREHQQDAGRAPAGRDGGGARRRPDGGCPLPGLRQHRAPTTRRGVAGRGHRAGPPPRRAGPGGRCRRPGRPPTRPSSTCGAGTTGWSSPPPDRASSRPPSRSLASSGRPPRRRPPGSSTPGWRPSSASCATSRRSSARRRDGGRRVGRCAARVGVGSRPHPRRGRGRDRARAGRTRPPGRRRPARSPLPWPT